MHIDCNRCEMRGIACADCVVSALLGPPGEEPQLTLAEQRAIRVLADAGMVAPLRLVVVQEDGDDVQGDDDDTESGSTRSAAG